MLKRRPKRRYISILHAGQPTDTINMMIKRHMELFGCISTERAAIRLMQSENNRMIIRCKLEQLDNVLISIAFSELPAITMGISGSINRLQKSISHSLVYC